MLPPGVTPTSVIYDRPGRPLTPDEPDDDDDDDLDNFKIPETLEEIYRLSNRNRRRHRELKAAKKREPVAAADELPYVETEEDKKVLDKYFGPDAGGGDCSTEEFLELIGWADLAIEDDPVPYGPPPPPPAARPPRAPGHRRRSRESRERRVTR